MLIFTPSYLLSVPVSMYRWAYCVTTLIKGERQDCNNSVCSVIWIIAALPLCYFASSCSPLFWLALWFSCLTCRLCACIVKSTELFVCLFVWCTIPRRLWYLFLILPLTLSFLHHNWYVSFSGLCIFFYPWINLNRSPSILSDIIKIKVHKKYLIFNSWSEGSVNIFKNVNILVIFSWFRH